MNVLLRYLFMIRVFAMTGLAIGLAIMQAAFGLHFPVLPVALALLTLGVFTLASWHYLRDRAQVNDAVLITQLLVDILALAVVVYFTGGSVNPFISLFILPVIFAAAGMQLQGAIVVALLAFGSYTLLMFFHRPLMEAHAHTEATRLHLWGMWYGFALSAALVAFFVARIGAALRRRDRALADARAESLRADKAIALGTLAAGTAHELGTPLATMAVICKEIRQAAGDEELQADLGILATQIERCKTILADMARDAGMLQGREVSASGLDEYLERLLADWRESRPGTQVDIRKHGRRPDCAVTVDRTLTQALTNILHNAADACSERVSVEVGWDEDELEMDVRDDGPGVDASAAPRLGREAISTKPGGLGIGFLLAQTTIQRLGGSVSLRTEGAGGAHASIRIPLARVTVQGT